MEWSRYKQDPAAPLPTHFGFGGGGGGDVMDELELERLKGRVSPCRQDLEASYERLGRKLAYELRLIREERQNVVPAVSFQKLLSNDGRIPKSVAKQVRKRGVLIVRNVIPRAEAAEVLSDLKRYMRRNGEDPDDESEFFYEIYWSKAQFRVRTHSNMVLLQRALLSMWECDPELDSSVDLRRPLMYVDRFRMRQPGTACKLRPHWDSGSIQRWSDPLYREAYSAVFSGRWEEHNPFLVGGRGQAQMDEHCSFFRAFQGWTALSHSGPGDGTLRVLPLLKEASAAVLLRPLLSDVKGFPGYTPGELFFPDPDMHRDLLDSMVSLPTVEPGDTVWWHPDVIHDVEPLHSGVDTNTVMYVPAGPECPLNRLYVERTRRLFARGHGPPDFGEKPDNELHADGRAAWEDVNEEGRVMLGQKKKGGVNN